jgi:Protein of unknown function (DUF1648)
MRGLPTALTGACVAAAIARTTAVWSQLPLVMASHFNAAGTADGFMPRGPFFTSLTIAFGTCLLVLALPPLLLRHVPGPAINIPHRDYWLAPERRSASVARLERVLAWFPVPVSAFMALVVELTIEANVHHSPLNSGALWTGLALLLGSLSILIRRLYRQFPSPPSSVSS